MSKSPLLPPSPRSRAADRRRRRRARERRRAENLTRRSRPSARLIVWALTALAALAAGVLVAKLTRNGAHGAAASAHANAAHSPAATGRQARDRSGGDRGGAVAAGQSDPPAGGDGHTAAGGAAAAGSASAGGTDGEPGDPPDGASSGRLSAIGLPLGTPALTLGLEEPRSDPVSVHFKNPPQAGVLFNLDTGRVLWQLHPYKRLRIASLTKMMTALIAVETDSPSTKVLITKQAVNMPGSKVGMLPLHKHVKLEPLLYGLLLPSGNDAAVAIAQNVSGTVPRFVERMNAEAARLGLGCTRYSSPSGYYDANNFSCAADLAELAHDDLAKPEIAKIVASRTAVLPFPVKGGKLYLYNNNPLLMYGYKGTTGLKTGYTEAAGPCLVATAQRDGIRLGVVLLHAALPGTEASVLLDKGFDDVYHLEPVSSPPIPGGV